ncbi:hypothetical protein QQ045_026163 [Rhodiola kirilowii]
MSFSGEAMPGHPNVNADLCDDDSNSFVSDSGTTQWLPKCPDEFKPCIGMVFQHVKDAINFYKKYAYIAGFSARLSTSSTRSDGVITHKYLVCSKEGFKGNHTIVDTVNSIEQNERQRRDSRCGCLARLCLNLSDGGIYRVYSFEAAHNHCLVDDIGKQYLNQNRQLSVVHQNFIMHCGKYRIGATKAHHLVKDLCGGFSNVGATVTDFKNFKRDLKLYIGHNDAQMIVDSLMNKKNTCKGYSFEYFVDEHGSLSRLFWADHVARGDCLIFGDVVSFDATYRTNKYNLVFVPFNGVDNHHRSVTLAAGLISKEDVESYTWLLTCFKNLLACEPSVIVTDQDAAMKVAISRVFPASRHRFCMWHITEKLQAKVGISKYREPGFLSDIKGVIWDDHSDINEFEARWLDLIIKYDLQCNSWLSDMYKLRDSWIPIYFREVTMGGLLRTTSRSESENSFFGRYIYGFMTLVEFFTGFNNAMDLQRHMRVELYIESRRSSPFLQSKHILEKHASEIFTKSVLKKIQIEIYSASHICGIQMMTDNEEGKIYTIYDTERGGKTFQVNFIESVNKLKCSCYILESRGYICRHLFCVMFFMRLERIPDYMVLPRWHKEASRKHNPALYVEESDFSKSTGEQIMLSSSIWSSVNLGIRSFGSNVGILQRFEDLIIQFVQENAPEVTNNNTSKSDFFKSILEMPQPTAVLVNNPGISKNKGCGKRVRGPREIAIDRLKKPQRLCGYCNDRGTHDKRTCPKRLVDEARLHVPIDPASEYDAAVNQSE